MKRLLFAACIFFAPLAAALAQSNPPSPGGPWDFNFVPTQGEWAAAWQSKMDYNGSPACTLLGCTLQGKLNLLPSTTNGAGLNCGQGSVPTTPVNGDLWCTTAGAFARINGSTVTLGGASGTWTVPQGGTGQVSFTASRPILGNGTSALAQGTVTTTNGSTLFATATGTPVSGNCVSWSNGNVIDAGGPCTTGGGGGTVSSASINQVAWYAANGTTVSGLSTCNSGYIGTDGSGVPTCRTALISALQTGITSVGALTAGSLASGFTVVSPALGGTGVNNGSFTSTLAGNFATSGAAVTLTAVGATNVTLPTSGNIPNSAGTSGGIPYYNTSTTIASSGVLGANLPVFGGGAGTAPIAGTRSGNTTQVMTGTGSFTTNNCASFDASGNIKDSTQPCGTANAAPVLLATITGSGVGSLTDVGGTCGANGCLGTTYTSYTIVYFNLRASSYTGGNVFCQIQLALTGAAYQTTSYTSGLQTGSSGTTQTSNIPCTLSGTIGTSAPLSGVSGQFVLYPNGTSPAQVYGQTGHVSFAGSPFVSQYGGAWNGSGTITGFRMFMNSAAGIGAINITGTVKVYGNP